MSFFKLEAGLQSDAQVIFWTLLELVKTIFLLEPLFLFGVLRQLDNRRHELEQIFRFVGEIDLILSVSSLRSGQEKVCCPAFDDQGIDAHQMIHPLVPFCIPNDLRILDRSILLTGSNMSGKTTFIRALGINMITGQTIHTCFADKMTLQNMRIYSAIRISDDLLNDRSYYFEEVLTIRNLLEKSEEKVPSLFLLDEIFKGTNTVERIAAGKAVLSRLSLNGNIVLVSTHDIELTDWLEDEYELFHFSEKVEDQTIDFDYLIKEGRLTNRNAIRILQINGYPDDLVQEAFNISEIIDQSVGDKT